MMWLLHWHLGIEGKSRQLQGFNPSGCRVGVTKVHLLTPNPHFSPFIYSAITLCHRGVIVVLKYCGIEDENCGRCSQMGAGYLAGNEPFAKNTLKFKYSEHFCRSMATKTGWIIKSHFSEELFHVFSSRAPFCGNHTHCAGGAVPRISHTQNSSTAPGQEFATVNL